MVNKFRETVKRPPLIEDADLFRIAMHHSRQMSLGRERLAIDALVGRVRELPLSHFYATVSCENASDDAFTTFVNDITTDRRKSSALTQPFNIAGVGVAASADGNAFFTVVLALRSTVGQSRYTGAALRSVMIAERCAAVVNHVRQREFRLGALHLDPWLCDLAYRFAAMKSAELSDEYVRGQIGACSDHRIVFGRVPAKGATPATIVENWMNLCGRTKTILGDFNRFGCGFIPSTGGGDLYSICIYVRSIHAAVIDGKETIIEDSIISTRIAEIMNEFREQYALPVLTVDPDLCDAARKHAESLANHLEENPLEVDPQVQAALQRYVAHDVTHVFCREIKRVPLVFMEKWRNSADCVSVILNQVNDIGVGACFDDTYECHVTVIIGSFGQDAEVTNVHYRF
jgi:uncharacterized protein YkwD